MRTRRLTINVLRALLALPATLAPAALARLGVPELPQLEGVDTSKGPFGAFEGILVYLVYLTASLSVVWVVLSVGRRVTSEFNEARRASGDFGRVVTSAAVGVGITVFVVFLANYLVDIINK